MKSSFVLLLATITVVALSFYSCQTPSMTQCDSPKFEKLKGLSMVAQPDSFKYNPMLDVQKVKANWVAVIPYAFTRTNEPSVIYNTKKWQWWGERPIGVRTTIQLAKASGINVMLKPQIWVSQSWIGQLDFEKDTDWEKWEADYEKFMMIMTDIAVEEGVELFCIGTEFEIHAVERPEFWRQLIKKIRQKYSGKLTYAANWDNFEKTTFWDDLDYVGINAYFPLDDTKTPDVATLKKAWKKPLSKIQKLYCKYNKPILFTEFGYLSVDGCAYNTWELEDNLKTLPRNDNAQMNALEALFDTYWEKDWWAGGFLWKWYPDKKSHEGHYVKDYTPQGKISEKCLIKWYGK